MEENRNKEVKNDNELTFFQFFCKHWIWAMTVGLMPMILRFVKNRAFEWDTFVISVLAVLAMGFCAWEVKKIKF